MSAVEGDGDAIEVHPLGADPLPVQPGTTARISRGPRRRWPLALAGVAALAATGAWALGAFDPSEPDPHEALRSAQEQVAAATSFRFEQVAVVRSPPDTSRLAVTAVGLIRAHGTVAAPDRWHLVVEPDPGGWAGGLVEDAEALRIGDEVLVTRWVLPGSRVPPWVAVPAPAARTEDEAAAEAELLAVVWRELHGGATWASYQVQLGIELALQAFLRGTEPDAGAVTRLLAELHDPVLEEARPDGGVVLRARLAPAPEVAVLEDIGPVDAVVHLDADRRPVSVRFAVEVAGGAGSAEVTVSFSDWGEPLEVSPLPDELVDRTPWIADEDVAALDPALLRAPTVLPGSLDLVGVTVWDDAAVAAAMVEQGLPPEEIGVVDPDRAPCPRLDLVYRSEASLAVPEAASFHRDLLLGLSEEVAVSVQHAACAWDRLGAEHGPEVTLGGHPARGCCGRWEVRVDDLLVTVRIPIELDDPDPDPAPAGDLVASLAPTTAAGLAAAMPDRLADLGVTDPEGGFGGLGGWATRARMGAVLHGGPGFAGWGGMVG